ncbi:MAG: serine/threonine-protein kinase [Candidatus Zixiibacteriota bacterium]|nr:MAG: serine/threonine-protein kinase [candidate division Zixibacteria bacterium]
MGEDDKTQAHVALTKDTMVGHYRIVEKIGAGGMGEVYLAQDTKLNRKVALKFLPPHLCQDEDCRKRFTREAQAAAGLDHPNIAGIHEVGEYAGRPFYSMQVIEGQSLREIVKGEDLSVERILEIAVQICEGLQAAHSKGIIHRDIKPSNILIDVHGRVRIVDFGLAAIRGSEHLTKTGSTLGTIGYMSPEQVHGKEIDHRSDLFSLGVVLYELITRQNPFKRDSEAATLKAVSDDTPEPLARFKSSLPAGLQAIIDKALDKDVKTRYQHADGMLSDLLRLKQDFAGTGASGAASRSRVRLGMAIALTVATMAVLVVVILLITEDKPPIVQPPEYTKLTSTGDIRMSKLSPDGEFYAYARKMENGQRKVYVADIAGEKPIEVFESGDLHHLSWSADGSELLIQIPEKAGGTAYIVPRLGGSPRRYSVPDINTCWTADASNIVSVQGDKGRLFFIDTRTRDTSSVAVEGLEGFKRIHDCSPDGRWILVNTHTVADGARLLAVSTDGSQTRQVFLGVTIGAAWGTGGDFVYAAAWDFGGFEMIRIAFDPESGETADQPITISDDLGQLGGFSLSADGRRMLCRRGTISVDLWRVELDPNGDPEAPEMTRLTRTTLVNYHPSISPDGKRLAFGSLTDEGAHLYIMPSEGGERKQITFSDLYNDLPAWSPDGRQLSYFSVREREGKDVLWSLIDLSDESVRQFPVYDTDCTDANAAVIREWYPGDLIAISGCGQLLFLNAHTGERVLLPHLPTEGQMRTAHYSPDGSSLAVHWDRDDEQSDGIWIIPLEDEPVRFVTGIDAHVIGWSPDADWIYFWQGPDNEAYEIKRVKIESGDIQLLAILAIEPHWAPPWLGLAPDATWMVITVMEQPFDLWLVENFDLYVE